MTDLLRALSVDIHRDQCGDFPVGAEVIAERPRLTEAPSRVSVRLNEKLEPRTISRWEDDGGYIPTVPRGTMLTQLSKRREAQCQDLVGLLGECHQKIRHFVDLARDIALHRDVPAEQVAQACADVERYFREALPLHVADEEESIEPRLRGQSPSVDLALDTVAAHHQQHASKVANLLGAIAKVRSQPCDDLARIELAAAAIALKTEFVDHLNLEETTIFPAIRELLPSDTQALIIDELRQRRRFARRTWAAIAQENQS